MADDVFQIRISSHDAKIILKMCGINLMGGNLTLIYLTKQTFNYHKTFNFYTTLSQQSNLVLEYETKSL